MGSQCDQINADHVGGYNRRRSPLRRGICINELQHPTHFDLCVENKRMGSLDEVLSQFSHDFDSDFSVPLNTLRTPEPGAPEIDLGPVKSKFS